VPPRPSFSPFLGHSHCLLQPKPAQLAAHLQLLLPAARLSPCCSLLPPNDGPPVPLAPADDIACCDLTLSAPADTNWTADLGVGVGECDDNYLPTNGTAPNSASRAGAGLAAVLAAAVAALVL